MHTEMHTEMHVAMHAYRDACVQRCMHTEMHRYRDAYRDACIQRCMHLFMVLLFDQLAHIIRHGERGLARGVRCSAVSP